jgi:hypothetical protein
MKKNSNSFFKNIFYLKYSCLMIVLFILGLIVFFKIKNSALINMAPIQKRTEKNMVPMILTYDEVIQKYS